MHFKNVSVFVESVPETIEFYANAFGFSLRYMHPSMGYAELETGVTLLSFISETFLDETNLIGGREFQKNRTNGQPIGALIALVAGDLASDYERAVAAGAVVVMPPDPKPWGQTVAYVRDNNGFLVELCTPPIR